MRRESRVTGKMRALGNATEEQTVPRNIFQNKGYLALFRSARQVGFPLLKTNQVSTDLHGANLVCPSLMVPKRLSGSFRHPFFFLGGPFFPGAFFLGWGLGAGAGLGFWHQSAERPVCI